MNTNQIGRFIAMCRKEKELTQEQLAEILGVSNKSISRWENGKTMPDISMLQQLCEILDIQVSELLEGRYLNTDEKIAQGARNSISLLVSNTQLENMAIFTEILIFAGILIAITLRYLLAVTVFQQLLTISIGCFVWGFGLVLRVKIRRTLTLINNDTND